MAVNLKTATLTQLKGVRGIGETKAKAIIRVRDQKGNDLSMTDLEQMPEIGAGLLNTIFQENLVTLGLTEEGEDKNTIDLLRSKIKALEAERDTVIGTCQLNMDTNKKDLQSQMDTQTNKFQNEKLQLLDEIKGYRENLLARDEEISRIHDYSKKLQNEMDSRSSLARLEKVIAERERLSYEGKGSHAGDNKGDPVSSSGSHVSKRDSFGSSGPYAPKMSIFDGKADWRPFYLQFTTIADKYGWSKEHRLFKIIECLRDKALKFYSGRSSSVQSDFDVLVKQMNQRFGKKELPHIVRRLLQDLRQGIEESIEEFAERAHELAVDGYPDTPDKFVETLAADAFLRGCNDKRAALIAMDKNPESLDQAIQFVRSAVANQKVIMGGRRSEVKRVTFSNQDREPSSDEEERPAVRFVAKESEKKEASNSFGNVEKRLKKTEDELAETKMIVKKILGILSQNQRSRSVQRSPVRNRLGSPTGRTGVCFSCQEEGHFARECPNIRAGSPGRSRSPSPLNLKESGI